MIWPFSTRMLRVLFLAPMVFPYVNRNLNAGKLGRFYFQRYSRIYSSHSLSFSLREPFAMYRQHYPDDPGMHNQPDRAYPGARHTHYGQPPSCMQLIKRSFVAIIVGAVLISVAAALLFWNEGRAVQTAKSLDEALHLVRPLKNTEVVFEENNGKLVHVNGALKTSKPLYDQQHGVAIHTVKLKRKVEMYQWVEYEERREVRDGDQFHEDISYKYSQEWRTDSVDSRAFYNGNGKQNPRTKPLESMELVAEDTSVGPFLLSKGLVKQVSNYKQFVPVVAPKDPRISLHLGMFYHSSNPQHPQVGDMRVLFEYAGLSGSSVNSKLGSDVVSILAKQAGHQLTTYETDAGDDVEVLQTGEYSAEKMIGQMKVSNAMMTWALRFVGWLLMFIGFGCFTTLIVTLVSWIPIVRDLVAMGVTTMNLGLSISLSLTIIALGWIRYRPWLGSAILACSVLPFVISRINSSRRSYARTL